MPLPVGQQRTDVIDADRGPRGTHRPYSTLLNERYGYPIVHDEREYCLVVRPVGIEPTTLGLEVPCSIR